MRWRFGDRKGGMERVEERYLKYMAIWIRQNTGTFS